MSLRGSLLRSWIPGIIVDGVAGMIKNISFKTNGQGLIEITSVVQNTVIKSHVRKGLCTLFIQHTSASLTIQENADPSAHHDLEQWLKRLVPENDPEFTHTSEGPDDMPSHVKAALTSTTLSIPIDGGKLALGIWQGIYLWEHRNHPHRRNIVIHILGD